MLIVIYTSYKKAVIRKKPLELNNRNIRRYVTKLLPQIPSFKGRTLNILNVKEVTEQTYVNYIFKATLFDDETFDIYLRQSRDHVKAAPGKKYDESRIAFEVNILTLLNDIKGDLVPKVLYLDSPNNVAVLSDIKRGNPLLVNELIEGHVHSQTGHFFGDTLATLHGETYGISHDKVRGSEKDNDAAVAFHLGMRLEPALKMEKVATESLVNDGKGERQCLVLGDLASKNIFVDEDKVRFLDLERSFIGDPAFDPAFLFCHYLIEVKPEKLTDSLSFIKNFMQAYRKRAEEYLSPEELSRFENRVIRYLGVTILYRLFGFYLVINVDRKKDVWTEIARKLLHERSDDLPRIISEKTHTLRG